jgi:4-hydroxybenzoate polyprenyltransferase
MQAGSGHRMSAVQSISVWLMGLISGGMAIASCVVNDYFDLKIDASNAPDKPLPSGACLTGQVLPFWPFLLES